MRTTLRVLSLLILAGICWTNPARAWVQTGSGATWPSGNISMVLMLGADKTLIDGGTWNGNATWAMDQWNRNMGRAQFTSVNSASTAGANGNRANEIFFATATYDGDWGANTLAVTISWYAGANRTESDILFNNTLTWDAYRGALRFSGGRSVPEFRRVALHELGHVIGLSHPDSAGQSVSAVMNATISSIETLMTDDKDGAAALYGPGLDNQPVVPSISTHPSSRTVTEGDYTSFSVFASGTPPLAYQWKKDGVSLSGANSSSYTINPVAMADAGDYTVVVSNAAGAVISNVAKLTVNKPSPPTVSSGPWNAYLSEGAEGSIYVYANGNALRYQWRRDGVDVPGANSSTLYFKPTQVWDAGSYDVVISNAGGSVTSGKASVYVTPARPASITSVPGKTLFQVGESLNLSVGVGGTSPMTIVWKRDGSTLSGQTYSNLSFYPAKASDAGLYELTASNSLASVSSGTIQLVAVPAKPPVITSVPTDVTVEVGYSVYVTLNSTGVPSPTFVWTKDGVTLPGWNSSSASFSNATASTGGTYSVTASNSAGTSATHSFKVNVVPRKQDPYFVRSPSSIGATAGSYPSFGASLNDATGAVYRWYKNGVEIPNSNSSSYYFSPMSAGAEGKYAIEAVVEGKTVRSAEAELKLLASTTVFQITSHPAAMVLTEGASDGLSVGYNYPSGGSYPAIQWYKDGIAIPGATGSYYNRSSWTSGDSGEYTAKLTLGGESLTTSGAKVEVRARPVPYIIQSPPSRVVSPGESLSLSVEARWGVNYQWRKNGVAFADTSYSNYYFSTATASMAGDYTVVVSNSSGSVESAVAKVTVLPGQAPVFTRHPGTVRTSGSSSASLDAMASGSNPISYQWKKDGVTLPGSTYSSLYLGNASPGLAGKYTLVASNAFGSAESEAGTVIYDGPYGKPIITLEPRSSSAVVGQTALLTAVAWGEPAPTIQWRKNGTNIAGATTWKLELKNVQLSSTASYDAVITNSVGSVTTQSAQLTIGVDNGRIVALSARAQVGTGGDVLIPGFLIGGSTPKKLLLRALGPTLTGYGVQGALADPKLVLKALGSDTVIASNDDWSGTGADTTLPALFTQVGASALATGSKDAALVATLAPGLYTAITSGADGGKGVALLEVFDVDPAAGKLTGISTRAIVGTGSNVLIPGIVVDGPVAKKLLIRVSGPALAQYGVQGTLADPKIELKSANGTTLQLNDNWDKTDTALTGAIAQIGLGAFADGSKDAALLATLNAGLYTIVISGADGGSGVALVEVYDVP